MWLENPDIEPEDKSDQQQCSRCGDWQHNSNYKMRSKKRGIRLKHCKACHKLYEILQDLMGQKDDDGNWFVKLPDGTLMALVDVATAIARRGYRLKTTQRQPPKPLADKAAEQIAKEIQKQGYPLEKIGSTETNGKVVDDD